MASIKASSYGQGCPDKISVSCLGIFCGLIFEAMVTSQLKFSASGLEPGHSHFPEVWAVDQRVKALQMIPGANARD